MTFIALNCGNQRFGPLSAAERMVYELAVLESRLSTDRPPRVAGINHYEWARTCDNLVRRRLLARDGDGYLTPVHPEIALSILNAPLSDEIREREQAMATNSRVIESIGRRLNRLAQDGRRRDGVRVVFGDKRIRDEIVAAALRCDTEIHSLRPGGLRSQDQFSVNTALVTSIFERGLRCQLLYHHTARSDLGLAARAKVIAENGGGVRTTAASFERLTVFDRRMALIPVEGAEQGIAVISDELLVEYLYRTFVHLWANAVPLEHAEEQPDEVSLDTRMAILRLMAAGLKDEAIANRLGMALRTCRRHISSILHGLNATSRFQAGIKIAKLGILTDEVTESAQSLRTDVSPLW